MSLFTWHSFWETLAWAGGFVVFFAMILLLVWIDGNRWK